MSVLPAECGERKHDMKKEDCLTGSSARQSVCKKYKRATQSAAHIRRIICGIGILQDFQTDGILSAHRRAVQFNRRNTQAA